MAGVTLPAAEASTSFASGTTSLPILAASGAKAARAASAGA
jgi:hypothetical protein